MEFLVSFLPLILIMVLMYFMMIRPQQKQQKEKMEMLDSMGPGDHVVTIGGLHGIVSEVDEVAATVVIDCEGIYLTYEKRAIATVNKTTASVVPEDTGDADKESEEKTEE